MVVEPVVYGASERPPRGDYRRVGADYTCAQDYAAYTAQDHDTYTIEFGLIAQADGLRAYGAGILSSSGELNHAVTSPEPNRIQLDLQRAMRTRYKIDSYQQTYFVIDSFEQLFGMTAPDFSPLYDRVKNLSDIAANALQAGDKLIQR